MNSMGSSMPFLRLGVKRQRHPRLEEKSCKSSPPETLVTNGAFEKRWPSAGKNVPYPYCNRLFSTYIMSSQVGDLTLYTRSPELTFKRSVSSPDAGATQVAFT